MSHQDQDTVQSQGDVAPRSPTPILCATPAPVPTAWSFRLPERPSQGLPPRHIPLGKQCTPSGDPMKLETAPTKVPNPFSFKLPQRPKQGLPPTDVPVSTPSTGLETGPAPIPNQFAFCLPKKPSRSAPSTGDGPSGSGNGAGTGPRSVPNPFSFSLPQRPTQCQRPPRDITTLPTETREVETLGGKPVDGLRDKVEKYVGLSFCCRSD